MATVGEPTESEPRWQALVALLAAGCLQLALPADLTPHPRWAFPAVVIILAIPLMLLHRSGRHHADRWLGFVVSCVVTLGLIISVGLLVKAMPTRAESPIALLLSAGVLWLTNVLVFALWYWRLDAGGPHRRDAREQHEEGDFLFPQLTLPPEIRAAFLKAPWRPRFLDYFFLAFNTSTAFSPTDTPVLTRRAKTLVMLQSLISLAILALLAARAVNTL